MAIPWKISFLEEFEVRGVKELQFGITQGSRKIESIPWGPRGISGYEICNGVRFISATWTLKNFFIRNNCKNSGENDECCLLSDNINISIEKKSLTDRIRKYCEKWLHFEQTLKKDKMIKVSHLMLGLKECALMVIFLLFWSKMIISNCNFFIQMMTLFLLQNDELSVCLKKPRKLGP